MNAITILVTLLFSCLLTFGQINFVDATDVSGIGYFGESWGAAWGDVNADGRPDLFVGNHKRSGHSESEDPAVYINLGGSFNKKALGAGNDVHGGAWMDLDNNGVQDLILTTGRAQRDVIIYNRTAGGTIDVRAFVTKIGVPTGDYGRSRSIVPFDVNNDGKLDIIIPRSNGFDSTQNGTALYFNIGYRFKDVSVSSGFDLTESCNLITLMDIDADRNMEFLASVKKKSLIAYDNSTVPLSQTLLVNKGTISDVISGDLNGDLASDMVVLYMKSVSDLGSLSDSSASAIVYVDGNEEGFRFRAPLPLQLDLRHGRKEDYNVHFGASSGIKSYNDYKFDTLLTSYPHGMYSHTPGTDKGVFIGYDSVSNYWEVLYSDPVPTLGIALNVTTLGGGLVEDITAIGFDPNPVLDEDVFLFNDGAGTFTPQSLAIDLKNGSRSGVIGDFDNDMDLDVYIQRGHGVPNKTNLLLENDGSGNFSIVPFAGGAEGSEIGLADAVTTVDYNNDGFLDIFLTAGATSLSDGGPHQLLRNTGNSNNWFEVRLQGSQSNYDAIGASVILYSGGVAQLREQNGGFHRFSQNHQRLHFGLGSNTQVDSLVVYWPSGNVQVLPGPIPGNQKRLIIEPTIAVAPSIALKPEESPLALLNIQPNPTDGAVMIDIEQGLNEDFQLVVYDLIGREVLKQQFESDGVLNVDHLPTGRYQIQLMDAQGNIRASTPLIIQ